MPVKTTLWIADICDQNPPLGKGNLLPEQYEHLKQDIRHQAVKQLIQVVETDRFPGFMYRLVNGFSRIKILKELGTLCVEALVYQEGEPTEPQAPTNTRVMLWVNGVAEVYCKWEKVMTGHWTEIIPHYLDKDDTSFLIGNNDQAISIGVTHTQARYLWLSLVRDEQLIVASCQLVEEIGKIGLGKDNIIFTKFDKAVDQLRKVLSLRGRQC